MKLDKGWFQLSNLITYLIEINLYLVSSLAIIIYILYFSYLMYKSIPFLRSSNTNQKVISVFNIFVVFGGVLILLR